MRKPRRQLGLDVVVTEDGGGVGAAARRVVLDEPGAEATRALTGV